MKRPNTRLNRGIFYAVILAAFGLCQFLFCTTQAMQCYAGGNIVDWNEGGYSWNRNWLSDLGRIHSWSSQPNHQSAMLFNGSIVLLGLSLSWFFWYLRKSVDDADGLTFSLQGFGLASSWGLVFLGMTPVDRLYVAHMLAMALWIVPIPFMAVLFALQLIRSQGFIERVSGTLATILAVLLIVAIGFYAASDSTSGYVVMQKIVVGIAMVWFAMVSFRVGLSAVETIVLSRQEKLALQARNYSNQLKRGHRRGDSRQMPRFSPPE